MCHANFTVINEKICTCLELHCPATCINCKEDIDRVVVSLVGIINEVIKEEIPLSKLSPYAKRWWTKELTDLKKEKNRLSNLSYRQCGLPTAPVHSLHKEAMKKLCRRISEVKKAHWANWLEEPSLKCTNPNKANVITDTNPGKVVKLAAAFFPPSPNTPSIPPTAYPEPLKSHRYFTCKDIWKTVSKLKLFKAPGIDSIQNIVIQNCINTIIDHFYLLFHAILELNSYPSRWLSFLTIMLCKPGKTTYDVAKSYCPIGLLDTMGKLFSTLVTTDLSFITDKHNLLSSTQFGSRPGWCTTDAMHLVTSKIKDAWRAGKVTLALFLDIQAAFPNMVKEHLLHNMNSCCVPSIFLTECSLTTIPTFNLMTSCQTQSP